MKNAQQLSAVSSMPLLFTSCLIAVQMLSFSSYTHLNVEVNVSICEVSLLELVLGHCPVMMLSLSNGHKSSIFPVDNRSLMYTRKWLLIIWLSVSIKEIGVLFRPAFLYKLKM